LKLGLSEYYPKTPRVSENRNIHHWIQSENYASEYTK